MNTLTKKLFIFLMIGIFLFSLTSAQETLGTFKQNDCVELKQTCGNCSFINFTRVLYPDSTTALGNVEADKDGSVFNYTFCNTSQLGTYVVYGIGDVDGTDTVFAYDFEITPSGNILSQASSVTLFGSLLVMLILSLIFVYVGTKTESQAGRIALFAIAGVGFLMVILYTIVTIQQTLYGFDSILNGIDTFWFVVKTAMGIGIFALIIVVFLIMIKAWKIKRGFT